MRSAIAIVTACVFLCAVYATHWFVKAKFEKLLKDKTGSSTAADMQISLPDHWVVALNLDELVYRFRFSLACLVLAIGLGIAALRNHDDVDTETGAPQNQIEERPTGP